MYIITLIFLDIPYHQLSFATGLSLRTIADHDELCLIESNDHLHFAFDTRRDYIKKSCFVIENNTERCTLSCGIDYCNYKLWYNTIQGNPYFTNIKVNPFITNICDNGRAPISRILHRLKQTPCHSSSSPITCLNPSTYSSLAAITRNTLTTTTTTTTTTSTSTPFGKPNINGIINDTFNPYGSIQDEHLDIIDLVARIKVAASISTSKIPQFCIDDHILSFVELKKIKRSVMDTNETVYTSHTYLPGSYWGLLFNQKAIATIQISEKYKTVYFQPIPPFDRYHIMNYVTY